MTRLRGRYNTRKESRYQRVLSCLLRNGSLSAKEVGEKVGISHTAAYRVLEELRSDGKIVRVGYWGTYRYQPNGQLKLI